MALALFLVLLASVSCKDDERNEPAPAGEDYIAKARDVLQDSIVLYAHAMMSVVNKTKIPTGCPVKYYFSWTDDGLLRIEIRDFSVGKMPLTIWFSCNVKLMQLNTWEREEYTDDGWLKFKGDKGLTSYSPNSHDSQYEAGTGGTGFVTGYLNVLTNRIEFTVDFNVMLVQTYVFEQTIDKSLVYRYDELIRQFVTDLNKWKEEHGES
jgi:hypothetical protein